MGLFSRRSLPADALAALGQHLAAAGLARPRVLAWASGPTHTVVALPEHLAVATDGEWTVWPWHEIQWAGWNDEGTEFSFTTNVAPKSPRVAHLDAPGRLPEAVRERVDQTFVVRRTVDLKPGRSVTVSGRRPVTLPGRPAAEITWHLAPGRGVDLDDPELARSAEVLLERLKQNWG